MNTSPRTDWKALPLAYLAELRKLLGDTPELSACEQALEALDARDWAAALEKAKELEKVAVLRGFVRKVQSLALGVMLRQAKNREDEDCYGDAATLLAQGLESVPDDPALAERKKEVLGHKNELERREREYAAYIHELESLENLTAGTADADLVSPLRRLVEKYEEFPVLGFWLYLPKKELLLERWWRAQSRLLDVLEKLERYDDADRVGGKSKVFLDTFKPSTRARSRDMSAAGDVGGAIAAWFTGRAGRRTRGTKPTRDPIDLVKQAQATFVAIFQDEAEPVQDRLRQAQRLLHQSLADEALQGMDAKAARETLDTVRAYEKARAAWNSPEQVIEHLKRALEAAGRAKLPEAPAEQEKESEAEQAKSEKSHAWAEAQTPIKYYLGIANASEAATRSLGNEATPAEIALLLKESLGSQRDLEEGLAKPTYPDEGFQFDKKTLLEKLRQRQKDTIERLNGYVRDWTDLPDGFPALDEMLQAFAVAVIKDESGEDGAESGAIPDHKRILELWASFEALAGWYYNLERARDYVQLAGLKSSYTDRMKYYQQACAASKKASKSETDYRRRTEANSQDPSAAGTSPAAAQGSNEAKPEQLFTGWKETIEVAKDDFRGKIQDEWTRAVQDVLWPEVRQERDLTVRLTRTRAFLTSEETSVGPLASLANDYLKPPPPWNKVHSAANILLNLAPGAGEDGKAKEDFAKALGATAPEGSAAALVNYALVEKLVQDGNRDAAARWAIEHVPPTEGEGATGTSRKQALAAIHARLEQRWRNAFDLLMQGKGDGLDRGFTFPGEEHHLEDLAAQLQAELSNIEPGRMLNANGAWTALKDGDRNQFAQRMAEVPVRQYKELQEKLQAKIVNEIPTAVRDLEHEPIWERPRKWSLWHRVRALDKVAQGRQDGTRAPRQTRSRALDWGYWVPVASPLLAVLLLVACGIGGWFVTGGDPPEWFGDKVNAIQVALQRPTATFTPTVQATPTRAVASPPPTVTPEPSETPVPTAKPTPTPEATTMIAATATTATAPTVNASATAAANATATTAASITGAASASAANAAANASATAAVGTVVANATGTAAASQTAGANVAATLRAAASATAAANISGNSGSLQVPTVPATPCLSNRVTVNGLSTSSGSSVIAQDTEYKFQIVVCNGRSVPVSFEMMKVAVYDRDQIDEKRGNIKTDPAVESLQDVNPQSPITFTTKPFKLGNGSFKAFVIYKIKNEDETQALYPSGARAEILLGAQ